MRETFKRLCFSNLLLVRGRSALEIGRFLFPRFTVTGSEVTLCPTYGDNFPFINPPIRIKSRMDERDALDDLARQVDLQRLLPNQVKKLSSYSQALAHGWGVKSVIDYYINDAKYRSRHFLTTEEPEPNLDPQLGDFLPTVAGPPVQTLDPMGAIGTYASTECAAAGVSGHDLWSWQMTDPFSGESAAKNLHLFHSNPKAAEREYNWDNLFQHYDDGECRREMKLIIGDGTAPKASDLGFPSFDEDDGVLLYSRDVMIEFNGSAKADPEPKAPDKDSNKRSVYISSCGTTINEVSEVQEVPVEDKDGVTSCPTLPEIPLEFQDAVEAVLTDAVYDWPFPLPEWRIVGAVGWPDPSDLDLSEPSFPDTNTEYQDQGDHDLDLCPDSNSDSEADLPDHGPAYAEDGYLDLERELDPVDPNSSASQISCTTKFELYHLSDVDSFSSSSDDDAESENVSAAVRRNRIMAFLNQPNI